jgi:hypothetical protein
MTDNSDVDLFELLETLVQTFNNGKRKEAIAQAENYVSNAPATHSLFVFELLGKFYGKSFSNF